jgi:predicted  nucleic acid-binding Zn-ribbon protein
MGGFMSQTETLMLVALGFVLALLLALLFGRGLWNVAVALGARHNAKNVPVQMLELQADRDRLRAEHAMMARKLELRLEDIKARMTEQMAEVSRSRNRVQTLIQQLETSESTLATRDREIAALTSQVEAHKADLEAGATTLSQLTASNISKDMEITKLAQSVSQLTLSLREKNGMLDRSNEELQTSSRMNAVSPALGQDPDKGEVRIKRRIAELTSIAAQMSDHQDGNVQSLNTPLINISQNLASNRQASLIDKITDAERETEAITQEIKALDTMLDRKPPPIRPAPTPIKPSPKANIISLAQRIKALQGGGE